MKELLEVPRLDVLCRWKAGFFIKAKTDFTEVFVICNRWFDSPFKHLIGFPPDLIIMPPLFSSDNNF